MKYLELGSKKIELDDEGFMVSLDDWDEDVAAKLAQEEGVGALSEDKLQIVRFLRDYYRKFSNFPLLGYVCKKVHQSRECISKTFIDPMKAWKVAGLPKPHNVFFVNHDGQHFRANPFY